MKATLIAVMAPFFGILVALGIVEIGVRLMVPVRTAEGPGWSDRPAFYFSAPNVPSMQGMPYPVPKPSGEFRIAVIGDSFTFAPYMQFTDTFAGKLEQMLSVSGSPRHVRVINYGVPAYSTSHEVPVARRAVDEGADLVILQITLNDPELKAHRPTGIQENMPDRFGPMKLSGTMGWLARHWRTLGFVLTRIHNTQTHQAYIDYFNDLFENQRSWKPFTRAMTDLTAAAKNRNVPIVAVVFPLFGMPMDEAYPFYGIHDKVAQLMSSLSTPTLDVSSIYKGIPLDRLQVIPGVDRHPNEIAHRMAAERIYLWLEEQRLLPDDLLIRHKFDTRLGIENQRPWSGSTNTTPASGSQP